MKCLWLRAPKYGSCEGHLARRGVAVVFVFLVGCVSLDQLAPPVDDAMILAGAGHPLDPQALVRGREIYLNRCIGCHSVEPVDRYSLGQWEMILPEMAAEAKLNRVQTADLQGYISAAHRFMSLTGIEPIPPKP